MNMFVHTSIKWYLPTGKIKNRITFFGVQLNQDTLNLYEEEKTKPNSTN